MADPIHFPDLQYEVPVVLTAEQWAIIVGVLANAGLTNMWHAVANQVVEWTKEVED
jgi:hypothetical protein